MEVRFAKVEAGQAELKADVSELKADVSGLKAGQARLEIDMANVKGRLEEQSRLLIALIPTRLAAVPPEPGKKAV
nr:uncharacterized protein [uncultured bacterium]